jgi:hypothetical protein
MLSMPGALATRRTAGELQETSLRRRTPMTWLSGDGGFITHPNEFVNACQVAYEIR